MKRLLLLFLPAAIGLAHADGVPGAQTGVSAAFRASLGDLEIIDAVSDSGSAKACLLDTAVRGDSSPDGTLDATFDYDVHAAVSVQGGEEGSALVAAGTYCRMSVEAGGTWAINPLLRPKVNQSGATASVNYSFQSTGGVSLSGNVALPASSFSVKLVGPDPDHPGLTIELFSVDHTNLPIDGSFSYGAGQPGDYELRITQTVTVAIGPVPVSTAEAVGSLACQLSYGTTTPPVFPEPGEYTHPRVGTFLTDSPKLTVANPAILSETPAGGGMTDVEVRAGLANSSACPWNDLTLRVAESLPGQPEVTVLDGGTPESDDVLRLDPLAAGATANPADPADVLTVRVADADLPAFRTSVLDGSRFIRHGRELWVFLYPVDLVSAERARQLLNASRGGTSFDRVLDVCPGTILLEHEPEYSLPFRREQAVGGLLSAGAAGTYTQGLDAALPLLVDGFSVVNTLFGIREHPGFPTLMHLIKHGTVRDTYDGSHPSGFAISEGISGDPVAKAHPIHFNRVPIGDAIQLSGSVGIGPGPISVEFEMEDLALKKLLVTATLRADATLLVETPGAADNAGAPLAEQERELFTAPLFTIVLPSGLTLTPELSFTIGASVTAPQGLSVPIQSAIEFTATAGVVDGEPYYDHQLTSEPPTVSPPALFGQLEASVEAWAKPELKCRLGINGLGVGPTFGIRVGGEFTLRPIRDPWWRLRGDLDLTAGVEFDLLNLVTFLDAETTLATEPLFDLDAGGPILPPGPALRSAADPPNPGLRPLAGATTRWGRALRLPNTETNPRDAFAFPVAGTTDLIVGAGRDLSRYRADGEHVWTLVPPASSIRDAVGLPDGGFAFVTGTGTLERYDADGTRLWISHRGLSGGPTLNVKALSTCPGPGGQSEYFLAGWHGRTDGTRVPCLVKLNDTGAVVWSKRYAPDRPGDSSVNSEANGLTLTAEGDVILCGVSSAMAVGPEPFGNAGPLGPDHALLMKIDGETGAFLWGSLLVAGRATGFGHVAADPEGNLYASGNFILNVLDDLPGMTVSKFTADGALIDTVLIGSATGEGAEPTIYPPSGVPNRGETPFDTIHDLVWANGGLWAAGQIGTGNVPNGLSSGLDPFTMRLTRDLAVTRFALHSGSAGDLFGAIADGGDGLVAVGHSYSFLPWPDGAGPEGTAPGTQVARLVAKLPWEGLMRFHDLSAGAQPPADQPDPKRGAHYVYPRVLAASDVTVFGGLLSGSGDRVPSSDLPFLASDLPLADLPFPPPALVAVTPLAHYQLDYVPREAVTDHESYLDWYQLDGHSDLDGDGLDLDTEFYHGTDPFAVDELGLTFAPHPVTGGKTLVFPVSPLALAEGWSAPLERSAALQAWIPATGFYEQGGMLYLDPFLQPNEPSQFYRLVPAAAP